MAKIRYSKDIAGLNKLMRSAGVREACRRAAQAALPYAESIAPERTGEYKLSFAVSVQDVAGPHEDRAGARLLNLSPHAARVEWEDGFHTLARVADHIENGG